METLNRAIGDAALFTDMLQKITHKPISGIAGPGLNPPDVQAWNAEVDRKRAERRRRRAVLAGMVAERKAAR